MEILLRAFIKNLHLKGLKGQVEFLLFNSIQFI